jgi:hypothetical protein
MRATSRLAQFVQPYLPEARLAHQWAKLDNADQSRKRLLFRPLPAMGLGLVAVCALTLGLSHYRPWFAGSISGTTVESVRSGSQSLTLPDGTRIELAAASRLVIDEYGDSLVRVSLRQGEAQFQVTHVPSRHFDVLVAGYEISVVGTRFSVKLESASHVTVHVEQGKVSVRTRNAPGDEKVLSSGESWTDVPVSSPPSSIDPSNDTAPEIDKSLDTPALQAAPSALSVNPKALFAAVPSGSVRSADAGPKELFELAELSRINGKLRDSAEALNKLRRTYRSDPRAGLASFELGRLRMDAFGDLTGGAEALHDAIRLSPGASFREDAESRLVQLYHRQANRESCQIAKAEYLKHFPSGAASKVVKQLCEF